MICLVDVSDLFYFLLRGGAGGVQGDWGGGLVLSLKIPGGGGSPGGGRGGGRVSAMNGGGGFFCFFSGPKCPPSLLSQRTLGGHRCS